MQQQEGAKVCEQQKEEVLVRCTSQEVNKNDKERRVATPAAAAQAEEETDQLDLLEVFKGVQSLKGCSWYLAQHGDWERSGGLADEENGFMPAEFLEQAVEF